jgi:uncharacterized protein (DUF2141 family)
MHRILSVMRIPCLVAALSFAAITASTGRPLAAQAPGSVRAVSKQGSQTCTLQIHVDGLRNSTGVVGAVIFASPDGWPEDTAKSVHHWPTEIPPGKHEATPGWDLPPGDYGVAVIHDENRNQKLDRNFLGIPKEGFGFANNPHVALSAPPFKAAIVHVTCPVTEINVHMIYK